MKHTRFFGAGAIVLMLAVCVGAAFSYSIRHTAVNKNYYAQLPPAPAEEDPLAHIDDEFIVDEGFTSHMPVVILDTGDMEPPVNTYYLAAQSRYADIEGMDPYVNGAFTLLDKQNGLNSPDLEPIPHTVITYLGERGLSSILFRSRLIWTLTAFSSPR